MAAAVFHSARDFRSWLERGEGDGEKVFTNAQLRERLADPNRFFESPILSGKSDTLPSEVKSLAERAAPLLGVGVSESEHLVRLLAAERLSALPVLHFDGSIYELLDVGGLAGVLPSLANLLHVERCEALQALAVVLRGAHDDAHPFAAQCRELAEKLLSEDLEKKLWELYMKVSSCPRFSASPEHSEVETVVKQGLELQLCVLECLLLAGYDPQISRRDPEQICRIAEECYRQRFLGSLPRAAHLHHWLLGDAEICSQAQCVGDLCLTLFIEHLDLEDLEAARHPLLSSPEHVKHLHKLIEGWVEICRHATIPAEATPATKHCGRHVALAVLAWSVLLGCMPESFRESQGFSFKRFFSSAVFQTEILQDAVLSIQERGFLMSDSRNAKHLAARSVARGLVSMVAKAFRLDGPMAPAHLAISKLASMAFLDEHACLEFWRLDYPKRQGAFLILHAWLMAFPRNLPALLELLCGLGQGPAAEYVAELLQAPLNMMRLPYRLLRHITEFEESAPSSSTWQPRAQLLLQQPAYVEELALRLLGLELPENHVSSCRVLCAGSTGVLQQDRPPDPERSPRSSQAHMVQWMLPPGVSLWRISVCAWDALLSRRELRPEDLELLKQIVRCFSQVLKPKTLEDFLKDLPEEEKGSYYGMAARLLSSLLTLAPYESARGSVAPLLRALARAPKALRQALWRLLEGAPHPRLRSHSAADLVEMMAGLSDLERQAGAYPVTCAFLGLVQSLFEACPIELLCLPWEVHETLGLPSFSRPGASLPPSSQGEVLGPLLDFTFGTCFSRCNFWPCRSLCERWAISAGCLQVAMAVFPALECFNWPEVAALSAKENGLGEALRQLQQLQLRVLRCWGEVSFVQNLLQCIFCDIAFGPGTGDAETTKRFVGFRSPALEEASSAAPQHGESAQMPGGVVPTTGLQLLSLSLQCLHQLIGLLLSPAGIAPHFQPLVQHVLELANGRESLGPVATNLEAQGALRRADLVQSLYAHICCTAASPVAQWATECLVSLLALWCRTEMPHQQPAASAGGRGLLLASLSVPSEAASRSGLVKHLAQRLLEVIGDPGQDFDFRSACCDLLRASLVSQPGLLLDTPELLPQCVSKLATTLAYLVKAGGDPTPDESRLFFVCLALMDDLASLGDETTLRSFNAEVKGPGKTSFKSLWQLLQKVFDALRPCLQSRDSTEAYLSCAALFRLCQRCTEGQAEVAMSEDLIDLLKDLLSAKTLEQLNADAKVPSTATSDKEEPGLKPELQREISFGVFRGAQVFASSSSTDFEMLQHPYGSADSETEGPCQRFQGLLGQLELRREVLAPSISAAGSGAMASGWLPAGGAAASLAALEAKGRPSVPQCFRSWGELCEMACGEALEPPLPSVEGRALLRLTLPQGRVGCFGSRNGVARSHSGSDIVDGYVLGGLVPIRLETLRLAAATTAAEGLRRGNRAPCADAEDPVLQALRGLLSELPAVSKEEGCQVACALTFEAFDDLAKSTARLARKKPQLEGIFAPLLWGLTHHLYHALQRLGHFMEKPRLFASFLALSSHLFALAPHGALSGESQAYGSFRVARGEDPKGPMYEMLSHETAAGLALLAQLTVVLRSAVARFAQRPLPRAAQMLAAAGLMSAGAEAHQGVASLIREDSAATALSEVVLHSLSLLMQLVPAVAHAHPSPKCSLQAVPLLTTLLEVLGQLMDVVATSEEVLERQQQRQASQVARLAGDAMAVTQQDAKMQDTGSAPGWPARAPMSRGSDSFSGAVQVLRTPEDAVVREASETQVEHLDKILYSGFSSLVFALAERSTAALRARQGERQPGPKQDKASELLRHVLLPRLLNCSFTVFAPVPDNTGVQRPGNAPAQVRQNLWQHASEASSACRLESLVSLLLRVAQTPNGVALLVERRVFVLMAYCPLLRHFVLNTESAYVVPSNAADNASMVLAEHRRHGLLSAWRRPAHSAWCRVLLLMSTLLASGAAAEEAEVFIQVYRNRFCYVFQSALQSGRLAVLEEASLMGRVLAFMSQRSATARRIAEDAAAQAMIFVMVSCLTERSTASEVFLPSSREERLAAQVPQVAVDGETTPAQVPSVFHQRVEYLGLELLRNLLLALLRISSLPQWLGLAPATAVKAPDGLGMAQGWPSAYQSVFGLKDGGPTLNSEDPVRLWALLMDVALEAGRKAVEYLDTLRGQREELHRLLIASSSSGAGDPWLPLSLSLVGVGESTSDGAPPSPRGFSPSHLAMGLTPMAAPHSPGRASPHFGPDTRSNGGVGSQRGKRTLRYKFAARRPHTALGSQLGCATPEGISLIELRKLASSVLELSCMLLCRFCQVTKSGISAPRGPSIGILHGLLSFLHEILSSDSGLDPETVSFLGALHAREQQLGTEAKVLQDAGSQPNPAFDGDAWLLGEA